MDKKATDVREQAENGALDLSVPEEKSVQPAQKGGIMKSVGDFFGSAFGGKSQDMNALIEEFTSEMTLVAEGLSQDQDRLNQRCDRLEARQAESEERLTLRQNEIQAQAREDRKTLQDLERRLKKIEDSLEKSRKEESGRKVHASERWTGVLRQATWLVGFVCVAWVIVTIINKFT